MFYADNDSNIAEIREWMEEHLKNVKSLRLPHPVLHEAAHQRAYRGAGLILWVAWNDERWRPFFNDPTYLDKYGKRAWQRLNITTPGVEVTQLPGDPDFLEVRHHIYLSYASKEQMVEYMEWFGTQTTPPVSAQILASVFEKNKDILVNRRIHERAAHSVHNVCAHRILEALSLSPELKTLLAECLPILERSLTDLLSYPEHQFRSNLINTIKAF